MESLGMKVNLVQLTKKYSLLSYKYLEGCIYPVHVKQFLKVADALEHIHSLDLVHGDVRTGNIIFAANGKDCHLIDFDYTSKVNQHYPMTYNGGLNERHTGAFGGSRNLSMIGTP